MSKKTEKLIRFWSKAAFLCEAIKELPEVQWDEEDEEQRPRVSLNDRQYLKRGFFNPTIRWTENILYSKGLLEAVKSYDETESAEERFIHMLLDRKFLLVMGSLKTDESTIEALKKLIGEFEYVNSDGTKTNDQARALITNELIRMLDEGETNKLFKAINDLRSASKEGLLQTAKGLKVTGKYALRATGFLLEAVWLGITALTDLASGKLPFGNSKNKH